MFEMKKQLACFYFFFLLLTSVKGQSPDVLKIRKFRSEHEKSLLNEFVSFLSIPNIAVDTPNLQKSAAFVMDMMKQRGIQNIQLLSPTTAAAPASVYGEVNVLGAT